MDEKNPAQLVLPFDFMRAEEMFLIIAKRWGDFMEDHPCSHPPPEARDNDLLACLHLASRFAWMFGRSAAEAVSRNKRISSHRRTAYLDYDPWNLIQFGIGRPPAGTVPGREPSNPEECMIANLDHHHSMIRGWMHDITYFGIGLFEKLPLATRLLNLAGETHLVTADAAKFILQKLYPTMSHADKEALLRESWREPAEEYLATLLEPNPEYQHLFVKIIGKVRKILITESLKQKKRYGVLPKRLHLPTLEPDPHKDFTTVISVPYAEIRCEKYRRKMKSKAEWLNEEELYRHGVRISSSQVAWLEENSFDTWPFEAKKYLWGAVKKRVFGMTAESDPQ